jgi:hypothetical protein
MNIVDNLIFIFFFYFLLIYFPIRIFLGFFLIKKFNTYLSPTLSLWSLYSISYAGYARLFNLLKIKNNWYQYVKKMPLWLDSIAFIIVGSELGFFLVGGSLYFLDQL